MAWLVFQETTLSPRLATDAILATSWWGMKQECVKLMDIGLGKSQCADVRYYRSVPHIRPPSRISPPPTFSAKVLAQVFLSRV